MLSLSPCCKACHFAQLCFLGRDNSFGRKRRDTDNKSDYEEKDRDRRDTAEEVGGGTGDGGGGNKVEIKEMFRVYESREIIPQESAQNRVNNTFKDIWGRGRE